MDIIPKINSDTVNNYISNGEKSLSNNRFFQFIDIMMNDVKMREFFDEFFSEWDEIKTTIMVMKAYQVIDHKIKQLECNEKKILSIEIRRKLMIGIIKEMLTTSECRQELIKNMNEFMGNNQLHHCNKFVENKKLTFEDTTNN
jgi:hypothetical protein